MLCFGSRSKAVLASTSDLSWCLVDRKVASSAAFSRASRAASLRKKEKAVHVYGRSFVSLH